MITREDPMEDNNIDHKSVRHCMVVYKPYPYYEIRVKREAEALISAGHQVDVICPSVKGDKAIDSHESVAIYRTSMKYGRKSLWSRLVKYILFLISSSSKLAFLHLRNPYDVIQIHNIPDFLVFSAIIPKITGGKVILDLHDLMPEFFLGDFSQGSNQILRRLLIFQEMISCKFADHVITVSEHWRQALIERGVPAEKCSVVMNLADPKIFHPQVINKKKPKNNDTFSMIYHGTIPKRYGLDLVLFAMEELKEEIPEIHFTIIGGGDHLEELKLLAEKLKLAKKHVAFISYLPPNEIPEQIVQAHLGIVPYRDDVFTNTLLPTKLMEYAYVGLPSIAARTMGISMYFDESMVKFFEPNNAPDLARCIFELYSDRELLANYAEGIKGFNRKHSWIEASKEYVAQVEKLA